MVRNNCDYIFMQPIYNKTQRDILWDLEAAFLDKATFNQLMDEVIQRELLPGNSASEPKKKVRIMVSADFEDANNPTEKFFHWTPVHMKELPHFKLCHPKYWEPHAAQKVGIPEEHKLTLDEEFAVAQHALRKVGKK